MTTIEMHVRIDEEMLGDIAAGDIFEVLSVKGDMLQLVRRYKEPRRPEPAPLGISVADGISAGERIGG